MQNDLSKTDIEADNRIIIAVHYYVSNKNMPITTARQILDSNLRNKDLLESACKEFDNLIICKQKAISE